jgi:hypothetical protein
MFLSEEVRLRDISLAVYIFASGSYSINSAFTVILQEATELTVLLQ